MCCLVQNPAVISCYITSQTIVLWTSGMTKREYIRFLDALATKYLQLHKLQPLAHELADDIEEVEAACRLLHVVREQLDRAERRHEDGPRSGYAQLCHQLNNTVASLSVDRVVETLREIGVMEALDEAPTLLLTNLQKLDLPAEDLDILRQCGIRDRKAELPV
jgi:HPt (histidine-containing phosphotransfer) domain-containing protein